MDMKTGYKQTEVGVIPQNWDAVRLGDKATKVGSGITPAGGVRVYKQQGRPFLRSQNVGWGKLLLDDVVFIDDETHASFPDTEIETGDVFLNITGASIGRSAVANARVERGNVNQHVCIIRTDPAELCPQFLNYFLLSTAGQRQIDSFQAGGNRQGLNFGQVRSFRLPLPSLPEQRAIAEALSSTDELIESLENLVAKKRKLKQGAMQDLLTGKKRLLEIKRGHKQTEVGEIPKDWNSPELGELLKSMQLGGNYKNSERETSWPLIKMGNLGRGNIKLDGLEFINSEQGPSSCDRLEIDNVLLNTRNTLDLVGKVAIWRNELPEAYFNSNLMRMQLDDQRVSSNCFMNYILNTSRSLRGLRGIAIGTTSVAAIYSRDLVKLKIPLPSRAEQDVIAEVLSDIDEEITALEAKLTKARQLKQGMMQELLTGRIRLV